MIRGQDFMNSVHVIELAILQQLIALSSTHIFMVNII